MSEARVQRRAFPYRAKTTDGTVVHEFVQTQGDRLLAATFVPAADDNQMPGVDLALVETAGLIVEEAKRDCGCGWTKRLCHHELAESAPVKTQPAAVPESLASPVRVA